MKRKNELANNNNNNNNNDTDEDKEYRENIIYELDMNNEKRVNGKNYIGDLKRRKRFIHDKSIDHPDNLRLRLSILEAQVEKLYSALEYSNVIKATPIVSLVYSNDTKKCHDYVSIIYNKWIRYLSVGCKIKDGIRLSNIFYNIDYYIFNGFFEKYMKYNNLQLEIIDDPNCMVDEYESRQRNREFVSIKMEGGNKKIVARFVSKALQSVCSAETKENFFSNNNNNNNNDKDFSNNNNNNNQNDIQLDNKLHNHLSKNKSLIDQLDNRGIFVNFSSNNSRLINQDRRFVILGSERPLFNTTVFTSELNNLNNALHNTGASLLNYSLVIFHAMLHLKCFIETGNYSFDHNVTFIQELINFTPSVLFGHFLLPPVSISV